MSPNNCKLLSGSELLSDKLSDLLELALSDLEFCENDSRYVIDMQQWLVDGCRVCLAGAVMAKTLNMDHVISVFDLDDCGKFLAINDARVGDVYTAGRHLGKELIGYNIPVVPYEENKELFKSQLNGLIHYLRENDE